MLVQGVVDLLLQGVVELLVQGVDLPMLVSARGGGYATARGGRSATARGGGVASARGGFANASGVGFASASCGGFNRAVSDDDDSVFTVSSFEKEYMCNNNEMAENHSSGNDDENYKDEDWQDKDDGYISDYKSDDNCSAHSSDDGGQTRMADRYLKGKFFKWKEGENIVLEKGMLFDDVYQFRAKLDLKLDGMHVEILEKFDVKVSRMQLYKAKRKALEKLEGSHAKSYAKISGYAHEVRKTNPGSLVKLELERIHPNPELPTFKSDDEDSDDDNESLENDDSSDMAVDPPESQSNLNQKDVMVDERRRLKQKMDGQ
ncbi:hypothetical protein F0562_029428 [Nyssa sinensis]|uniref:Uncharacterized protein n=1 Tax=Nyssa sinensis TaxID=561372 RepID=A0A5J5B316_9ASTE|nr:hypothetical protein F0562_029428 [Nyssa sinensis]